MIRKLCFILALLWPAVASAQAINWGDYTDANQIIYVYFNTVGTDGVAETLTSGALEIYEDGSATQITTAETLTASFDSIVGYNQVAVDLNDAGFEPGKVYTVMLTAGTVDAVSVVGRIVGVFSVERTPKVNAVQFAGQTITAAAGVTLPSSVASPTNITAGTIATVTTTTNLTNLPTIPNNWLTSGGTNADFIAEINTEVVDALNVDTYAEPGQATPAATATLAAKINYLYKAFRNRKAQTATTFSLYNDDATTVDQKATTSDAAGVTGVTEMTTGP